MLYPTTDVYTMMDENYTYEMTDEDKTSMTTDGSTLK
ncbi:hypothetical protein PC129_g9500 [Phytophthora cactorum]|nr:hypothetical protein Pcac1_g5801 [Phytophthora cactorum]KAG3108999.1 hypothetical protein PI125_g11325 [Phytophthora idaei]KAG2823570.1 hypothetical protein PC112_g10451 [Phytophthora cactorum]KAG2826037.1 hypothetical protein PC111_g9142 [Phytophthora cactorum]KAG2857396.1 hypothetical protein PC113_g10726 [Phytophthora cactorum]